MMVQVDFGKYSLPREPWYFPCGHHSDDSLSVLSMHAVMHSARFLETKLDLLSSVLCNRPYFFFSAKFFFSFCLKVEEEEIQEKNIQIKQNTFLFLEVHQKRLSDPVFPPVVFPAPLPEQCCLKAASSINCSSDVSQA